jgi:hypothetical protein
MRSYIVIGVAMILAACATPEQRSAQMQHEVDMMIAEYGPACEKLGYRAETDGWRDCILRLNTRETIVRYSARPTMSTCFGHRGFFHCSTF